MPVPESPIVDLLGALQKSVERAREDRKTIPKTKTLVSICSTCNTSIEISIVVGEQKWHDVAWQHVETAADHEPLPELRVAIDATCPGCNYPEIGFAPAREEFICSRCGHTQTERPKD